MLTLLVVTLSALALGTGTFIVLTRNNPKHQLPQATATRHPMNLRVDDVVVFMNEHYRLEGLVCFEEAGRTWFSYRLEGDLTRWLVAKQGDTTTTMLLEEIPALTDKTRPPTALTWNGTSFTLETWGQARPEQTGKTERPNAPRCEYHEYRGPGDKVLLIEQWGDGHTATLAGCRIDPGQLEFMPGDLVEASR